MISPLLTGRQRPTSLKIQMGTMKARNLQHATNLPALDQGWLEECLSPSKGPEIDILKLP
eukprot:2950811-Rhodomonas_salina.1